jgi:lipocalin
MSWFKKAATDDGGLSISRSPSSSNIWRISRNPKIYREPSEIRIKKNRKKGIKNVH